MFRVSDHKFNKKNVILRLLEWCWVAIKLIKKCIQCQSKYDYVVYLMKFFLDNLIYLFPFS